MQEKDAGSTETVGNGKGEGCGAEAACPKVIPSPPQIIKAQQLKSQTKGPRGPEFQGWLAMGTEPPCCPDRPSSKKVSSKTFYPSTLSQNKRNSKGFGNGRPLSDTGNGRFMLPVHLSLPLSSELP